MQIKMTKMLTKRKMENKITCQSKRKNQMSFIKPFTANLLLYFWFVCRPSPRTHMWWLDVPVCTENMSTCISPLCFLFFRFQMSLIMVSPSLIWIHVRPWGCYDMIWTFHALTKAFHTVLNSNLNVITQADGLLCWGFYSYIQIFI